MLVFFFHEDYLKSLFTPKFGHKGIKFPIQWIYNSCWKTNVLTRVISIVIGKIHHSNENLKEKLIISEAML